MSLVGESPGLEEGCGRAATLHAASGPLVVLVSLSVVHSMVVVVDMGVEQSGELACGLRKL